MIGSNCYLLLGTVFQSFVAALVLRRLDYGNGTSLPHLSSSVSPERSDTAHIPSPSCDHITDGLVSLHWLRVSKRIVFKVAVQTYRALHGDTLRSTCSSSRAPPTSLLGTDSGPQSPTVCSFLLSDFLLSIAAIFL